MELSARNYVWRHTVKWRQFFSVTCKVKQTFPEYESLSMQSIWLWPYEGVCHKCARCSFPYVVVQCRLVELFVSCICHCHSLFAGCKCYCMWSDVKDTVINCLRSEHIMSICQYAGKMSRPRLHSIYVSGRRGRPYLQLLFIFEPRGHNPLRVDAKKQHCYYRREICLPLSHVHETTFFWLSTTAWWQHAVPSQENLCPVVFSHFLVNT